VYVLTWPFDSTGYSKRERERENTLSVVLAIYMN
jgi:hypothetical protein